ncbi:hypothetical protein FN846DRAFT_999807 [Sphaerosporella brunnea]|uniref:Uncharacterized protein n=1 Tax=Sphaerosporella brunnea TaxID=1250544 RepID=A0A5J5F639_9PEZI|nr:hypothetical protein FN846DRAFT_999807 [Sphaerosporella brunnea]
MQNTTKNPLTSAPFAAGTLSQSRASASSGSFLSPPSVVEPIPQVDTHCPAVGVSGSSQLRTSASSLLSPPRASSSPSSPSSAVGAPSQLRTSAFAAGTLSQSRVSASSGSFLLSPSAVAPIPQASTHCPAVGVSGSSQLRTSASSSLSPPRSSSLSSAVGAPSQLRTSASSRSFLPSPSAVYTHCPAVGASGSSQLRTSASSSLSPPGSFSSSNAVGALAQLRTSAIPHVIGSPFTPQVRTTHSRSPVPPALQAQQGKMRSEKALSLLQVAITKGMEGAQGEQERAKLQLLAQHLPGALKRRASEEPPQSSSPPQMKRPMAQLPDRARAAKFGFPPVPALAGMKRQAEEVDEERKKRDDLRVQAQARMYEEKRVELEAERRESESVYLLWREAPVLLSRRPAHYAKVGEFWVSRDTNRWLEEAKAFGLDKKVDLEDSIVTYTMRATKAYCNRAEGLGRKVDEALRNLWFDTIYDEVGELLQSAGVTRPAMQVGHPVYECLRKDGGWRRVNGVPQRRYDGVQLRPRVRLAPPAPPLTPAVRLPEKQPANDNGSLDEAEMPIVQPMPEQPQPPPQPAPTPAPTRKADYCDYVVRKLFIRSINGVYNKAPNPYLEQRTLLGKPPPSRDWITGEPASTEEEAHINTCRRLLILRMSEGLPLGEMACRILLGERSVKRLLARPFALAQIFDLTGAFDWAGGEDDRGNCNFSALYSDHLSDVGYKLSVGLDSK